MTKFHKSYAEKIGLTKKIQSYIQFITLKKTMESISYDYRRDEEEIPQECLENEVFKKEGVCEVTEIKVSVDDGKSE